MEKTKIAFNFFIMLFVGVVFFAAYFTAQVKYTVPAIEW